MNAFDFAPLFRTAIGFDRLARLVDTAAATADVDLSALQHREDRRRQLSPDHGGGRLRPGRHRTGGEGQHAVRRRPRRPAKRRKAEVLYRGIAGRAFERRFVLADHIVVEGADLQNGLLHVGLKRVVPEALKPRRIPVSAGARACHRRAGAVVRTTAGTASKAA